MNAQELFTFPSITLAGKIEAPLLVELDKQIKVIMEKKHEKALIILTTHGGEVGYSISIYERLRLLQKSIDLTLVGIGIVQSAGVTICMAFPKEKRWLTAETSVMFHESQIPPYTLGSTNLTARELLEAENVSRLTHHRQDLDWIFNGIAKGTGQKKKIIRKMAAAGTYFTAKEALDFGLVGGIVSEK